MKKISWFEECELADGNTDLDILLDVIKLQVGSFRINYIIPEEIREYLPPRFVVRTNRSIGSMLHRIHTCQTGKLSYHESNRISYFIKLRKIIKIHGLAVCREFVTAHKVNYIYKPEFKNKELSSFDRRKIEMRKISIQNSNDNAPKFRRDCIIIYNKPSIRDKVYGINKEMI